MKYTVAQRFLIPIIALLLFTASAISYAEQIVIIANKDYPASYITIPVIKDIYLGDKTTEADIKIRPYDQKELKIKKEFLTRIIGMNEDKYNAYWIKKVFQEGGIPPVIKASSEELIKAVKAESGGIGYVWKSEGEIAGLKILLTIDTGD